MKRQKRAGRRVFSASKTQSYLKLSEMDRTTQKKKLPVQGEWGLFLPAEPKVTQHCLKWIDPV